MVLLRRRRGVHALLAARPDRPRERRRPGDRLAPAGGRPGAASGVSRSGGERVPALDADPGRRRALRPERARAAGGVRSGHRRDHLAAGAVRRHRSGGRRRQHAGRRLVDGRRGSPAAAGPGRVPVCARRADRPAGRVVRPRRPGPGRPGLGASAGRRVRLDGGTPRGRRRRGRRRHHRRLGRRRDRPRGGPRGHPRFRRADRRVAVDVPRGSPGRRVRRRDLGRRLRRLLGRSGLLVLPDRRRRAGIRLRAAVRTDRDGLRRPPARRQPLLGQPRRPRRRHRRAGLALSDGAPRRLGVRHGRGRRYSATSRSTAGASRR